uniref:Endonuclease/exonuclease/phosphatase domain-containing protein n=1 Tax=viral metagenome TaxID=1070528 RepID=A0A6C0C765_9ZZZZ
MNKISICTWNLWFDPYMRKERINAAMNELLTTNADVICLQEINTPILFLIKSHPISNSYHILYNTEDIDTYGQIFLLNRKLSHITIEFRSISFPHTRMNRKICHLILNKRIHIFNVHLESDFTKPGYTPKIKFEQLQFLLEYANKLGCSIIAGDCNIASDEDVIFNNMITAKSFADLNNGTLTYDCIANTNIHDTFRSRLDRILCNFDVVCKINRLLGMIPISMNEVRCFPSDHFGLNLTVVPV